MRPPITKKQLCSSSLYRFPMGRRWWWSNSYWVVSAAIHPVGIALNQWLGNEKERSEFDLELITKPVKRDFDRFRDWQKTPPVALMDFPETAFMGTTEPTEEGHRFYSFGTLWMGLNQDFVNHIGKDAGDMHIGLLVKQAVACWTIKHAGRDVVTAALMPVRAKPSGMAHG